MYEDKQEDQTDTQCKEIINSHWTCSQKSKATNKSPTKEQRGDGIITAKERRERLQEKRGRNYIQEMRDVRNSSLT